VFVHGGHPNSRLHTHAARNAKTHFFSPSSRLHRCGVDLSGQFCDA